MENSKKAIEEQWPLLLAQIKATAKAKGITNEMIAERTGFIQSNVNRMLNAKYPPKLSNFLLLCEAVGLEVELRNKG